MRSTSSSRPCPASIDAPTFSPDGSLLGWSGMGAGVVRSVSLEPVWSQAGGVVSCVAFSPDSRLLVTGTYSPENAPLRLMHASDGKLIRELTGHTGGIMALAFSPDGTLLAAGGEDGWIRCWDIGSGALVTSVRGPQESMGGIAFLPDSRHLVGAGRNIDPGPPVYVWKLRN